MSLLGRRAYARGRVFVALELVRRSWAPRRPGSTRPGAPERPSFWTRWAAAVMRRPAAALAAGTAVLTLAALPALALTTTDGALRQFPHDNETRQGFEAARAMTGPGAATPVQIVAPQGDAAKVTAALRRDPEVARVNPPAASKDGAQVLIAATPRHDGESAEAKALVERLRGGELPPGAAVGGTSAALVDFKHLVDGSMWKIALFVLGLSYVVLLLLLRSVVLPLKAVAMNLLSVGAAYGVLALVFGHVQTITPPLVLAVVFGLSMDYEVFLLSNIRERWRATGDTPRAVGEGLAASARTITSAALIMTAVFAVFTLTGVPSIQEIGLGCAVAIAVDATIVRLILVPAAMQLLGRWNWWLPAPLARVLPNRPIETEAAAA
jgi:RND superfamily putative drug exporter